MKVLAVTNLYPTPSNPSIGTFVEQQVKGLRQLGLQVDVLVVERAEKNVRAYINLGTVVQARMKTFRPDIVHVMYGGLMAEVVTRIVRGIPIIVSFCGTDILGGPYLPFFRRLTVKYGVLASHFAAKRADGIVVKSRNLKEALPQNIDSTKVRIIPNGIDLERFKPLDREVSKKKLGWKTDPFHILVTAYPGHVRKKWALAQAAVGLLTNDHVDVELHQLRGVPHSEVPLWLNASDCILLTSIHEGSPNIVKEALACDRPVVSVDVGDVRERIGDIEGCYVAKSDPHDLSEKLRLVMNGPRKVEGRTRMQDLSLDFTAHALKKFYCSLVDRPELEWNCTAS